MILIGRERDEISQVVSACIFNGLLSFKFWGERPKSPDGFVINLLASCREKNIVFNEFCCEGRRKRFSAIRSFTQYSNL
jgi:hypothetical protein